jgi:two-component system OmpR family sensor kinase
MTTIPTTSSSTTTSRSATTISTTRATTMPPTTTDDVPAPDRGWPRQAVSSIRVRIVVGYVLLLTVALFIAVAVTRQVQLTRLDRDIDRALVQEIEELRRLAEGVDPTTGQPFGDDVAAIFEVFLRRNVPSPNEAFYTIVDGAPHLYSFDAPVELARDDRLMGAWASVTEPTRRTYDTAAGEARTLAVPLTISGDVTGVFVVAWFPAEGRDEVLQAMRVISVAGIAVLLVTTLVAWSLAGRVLRPVRELTMTARQISDSELSARIPVVGNDELAVLGRTFNDMLDRLEHGFSTQRQFLDDVAHELRTPITIVRGHLELLGDDRDERDETVAVVTDELDRMSRYVDDLLVLAKSDHPDFLRLEPVDLGDLADAVMQRVRTLGHRSWVLDEAPAPGQFAAVADPDRLTQAILNLAQNATQHTADGDEIGIGVACDGHEVRLWVRDTGPGVDPAIADRLFLRYSRGVTSRIGRPDGMGLGLSIVDAIARAHGGQVTLENRAPHGATFVVAVPLEADPAVDDVEPVEPLPSDLSWEPPSVAGPPAAPNGDAAGTRADDRATDPTTEPHSPTPHHEDVP